MQKLTKGQSEVLGVFASYPVALPDHALVPLAQHAMAVPQSSSSIRSRRAELVRSGHVVEVGMVKMPKSHRTAKTFRVA